MLMMPVFKFAWRLVHTMNVIGSNLSDNHIKQAWEGLSCRQHSRVEVRKYWSSHQTTNQFRHMLEDGSSRCKMAGGTDLKWLRGKANKCNMRRMIERSPNSIQTTLSTGITFYLSIILPLSNFIWYFSNVKLWLWCSFCLLKTAILILGRVWCLLNTYWWPRVFSYVLNLIFVI